MGLLSFIGDALSFVPGVGPIAAGIGNGLDSLLGGGGSDQAIQQATQGMGIAQVAALAQQAEQERKDAIAGAVGNWKSRQPLRDAAIARLLGPTPTMPDLGGAVSDAANPFWHSPGIIPMGGPGPGMAAGAAPAGPPEGTPIPIRPTMDPSSLPRGNAPGPGGWVAGGGWLNPGGGALPGLPAGGRGPIASPRFNVTAAPTVSDALNRAMAQLAA